MLLILETLFILFIAAVFYLLARPFFGGAIYYPTRADKSETILKLARVKPGQKVADLGSGDGRILLAFAKAGAVARGYEINPILVWYSRRAIKKAGLEKNAFVEWKSMWRADISDCDTVFVYDFPNFMSQLGEKLERELRVGTKVISNVYKIPEWEPLKVEDNLYLYEIGNCRKETER